MSVRLLLKRHRPPRSEALTQSCCICTSQKSSAAHSARSECLLVALAVSDSCSAPASSSATTTRTSRASAKIRRSSNSSGRDRRCKAGLVPLRYRQASAQRVGRGIRLAHSRRGVCAAAQCLSESRESFLRTAAFRVRLLDAGPQLAPDFAQPEVAGPLRLRPPSLCGALLLCIIADPLHRFGLPGT